MKTERNKHRANAGNGLPAGLLIGWTKLYRDRKRCPACEYSAFPENPCPRHRGRKGYGSGITKRRWKRDCALRAHGLGRHWND
jgi:hypothetical protein